MKSIAITSKSKISTPQNPKPPIQVMKTNGEVDDTRDWVNSARSYCCTSNSMPLPKMPELKIRPGRVECGEMRPKCERGLEFHPSDCHKNLTRNNQKKLRLLGADPDVLDSRSFYSQSELGL
jgi:hypothetical protein